MKTRIPLSSMDFHNILKLVHRLKFSPQEKDKIFKRKWLSQKQMDEITLNLKRLSMEDIIKVKENL